MDSLLILKQKKGIAGSVPPSGTPPTASPLSPASGTEHTPPALSPFDPTLGVFGQKLTAEASPGHVRRTSGASVASGGRGTSPAPGTVSRSSSAASTAKKNLHIHMPAAKSAMNKFRKADPKLTIRPFRSRVTFSDETKQQSYTFGAQTPGIGMAPQIAMTPGGIDHSSSGVMTSRPLYHVPIAKPSRGMRSEGPDLTISSPELSEADLLAAYIEHRDCNKSPTSPSARSSTVKFPEIPKASGSPGHKAHLEETKHESIEEHQATVPTIFPTDLIAAIGLPSEYWLRHQSLPNIQEIGEESSVSNSPTGRTTPRTSFRYSVRRQNSDRSSKERQLSIRRQQAEDKTSPPKETSESALVRKESDANEKRKKFSGSDSRHGSSGASASVTSTATIGGPTVPPTQRRYRKRTAGKPSSITSSTGSASHLKSSLKQSSTESDSGSYVTARSCVIQISQEDDDSNNNVNHEETRPSGPVESSRSTGFNLAEFKKSSHSTSSSVASYSSARDMFGRTSLDNPILDNLTSIPTIVVVQTVTPSSSDANINRSGLRKSPSGNGQMTDHELVMMRGEEEPSLSEADIKRGIETPSPSSSDTTTATIRSSSTGASAMMSGTLKITATTPSSTTSSTESIKKKGDKNR